MSTKNEVKQVHGRKSLLFCLYSVRELFFPLLVARCSLTSFATFSVGFEVICISTATSIEKPLTTSSLTVKVEASLLGLARTNHLWQLTARGQFSWN